MSVRAWRRSSRVGLTVPTVLTVLIIGVPVLSGTAAAQGRAGGAGR